MQLLLVSTVQRTALDMILITSYLLSAALVVISVQGQTCGVFGTDSGEFDADETHGFYLNTQDPAPCDGTVDKFQYCHYQHSTFRFSYAFTFAVYRETSPGLYSAVSEAFTAEREPNLFSDFACLRFSVNNQIQIQADDMIGACIYNPPGLTRETFVVGEDAGADRYLMTTSTSQCGDATVPSHVMTSSLSRVNSHVLHIYAYIGKQCLFANSILYSIIFACTNAPASSPTTEPTTHTTSVMEKETPSIITSMITGII